MSPLNWLLVAAFFNQIKDATIQELHDHGFKFSQIGTSLETENEFSRFSGAGATEPVAAERKNAYEENRSFWQKMKDFFAGESKERLLLHGSQSRGIVKEVEPIEGEVLVEKAGKGVGYCSDFFLVLQQLGITHHSCAASPRISCAASPRMFRSIRS